jgi:hypothetical protein
MASRSTRRGLLGTVAVSAVVLALGAAPFVSFGADHLDAPGLTPPSGRADADINDVYAFQGSNEANTVLVMTTHPAAGAIAPLEYATDVRYLLQIDRAGDGLNGLKDVTYRVKFKSATSSGRQMYSVVRAVQGNDPQRVARGWTGSVNAVRGGGHVFAGLRSDPFFFDLDAFRGAVLGQNDRTFCDDSVTDFFESLNTNAIVLEVPDQQIGGQVGVWAETRSKADGRIDRKGRPAINTVFNSGEDKNAFNETGPFMDLEDFGDNVVGVLLAFSALDPDDGAYSQSEAETLASVLLPDMLTYDTSTDAAGPLNGRALADDVIDAELNIVTGGFAFPGRDDEGGIPSDCVGPHDDYMNRFPYLGEPH